MDKDTVKKMLRCGGENFDEVRDADPKPTSKAAGKGRAQGKGKAVVGEKRKR